MCTIPTPPPQENELRSGAYDGFIADIHDNDDLRRLEIVR
jgi:hypothetical protein